MGETRSEPSLLSGAVTRPESARPFETGGEAQGHYVIRAGLIATIGLNIRAFFRGQLAYLQQHGFHFTVITSDPTPENIELPDGANYLSVPLTRSITPWTDLRSIWKLWRILVRRRLDMVQYTTPKGALLASIAAVLARVPIRIYLFWGVYYSTQTGIKRQFFKLLEKLTCRLSTHVLFDGHGIRTFALAEGLSSESQSSVIGHGSDNGVDLEYFDRESWVSEARDVRIRWSIPPEAVVIGAVMRLVGDKGINELVEGFRRLTEHDRQIWLLLVGPLEDKHAPRHDVLSIMRRHPRIVLAGLQTDVRPYYAAMDLFVLPTYREGFSAVTLEAAAMTLPVITTDAIGAAETILDGRTGLVVPARSVGPLADAMRRLVENPDLRHAMGRAGRRFVQEHFEQRVFWEQLRRHREELLIASGRFVRHNGRLVPQTDSRRQPSGVC